MKMLNRTGPKTEPWGTPLVTGRQLDLTPSDLAKFKLEKYSCESYVSGREQKSKENVKPLNLNEERISS